MMTEKSGLPAVMLAPRLDQRWRVLVTNLVEARAACSLTQRALAARLGVTKITVTEWETRLEWPMVEHFLAWAAVLDCAPFLEDGEGRIQARVRVPSRGRLDTRRAFVVLAHGLRDARKLAGVSQEDLARSLDVSDWTLRGWELGRRTPRLGRLLAWTDTVGYHLLLTKPHDKPARGRHARGAHAIP